MKPPERIARDQFLADRHGKTFADVLNEPGTPFDEVLSFFNHAERQQRMEDAEIHHDRAPLAGVVRELESEPVLGRFFETADRRRSTRLRQAIGVLVRLIMERRGWVTTGKKGSLGVRSATGPLSQDHNTGGLALWFIRAERYHRVGGVHFRSTRERCADLGGVGHHRERERTEGGAPAADAGRQP
ncbi:hypothetical protein [Engelhardtia mirabilis]|uniref:hypothetical protein n=1 Tax=Engelhardtia mirabilis TaxID=2528011 RepID=UPI0011A43773